MNHNVLVVAEFQKGKLAVLKADQKIEAIQYCPSEKAIQVGDIYVARTVSVVKNLNAAFVELIPGVKGFLSLEGLPDTCKLHEGDEILVQVDREAVKSKDAVVTTTLSLAGEYVVLSTQRLRIGYADQFSKRMKENWKQALVRQSELAPSIQFTIDEKKNLKTNIPYGIIFRSALAEEYENVLNEKEAESDVSNENTLTEKVLVEKVLAEIDAISRQLTFITEHAASRTCYSCMHHSQPDYVKFLMQIRKKQSMTIHRYVTDSQDVYDAYKELLGDSSSELEFYTDSTYPLYKLYSLESALNELLGKKVWLKSGGNLIIEPTEALTVIDVNTAKNVDRKAKEEAVLRLNLEAAEEIARQLRLRNLSGIIIVDFINMKTAEHNERLLNTVRELLNRDPVHANLIDLTPLGLVEITRKKVDKSLRESLDNQ